VKLYWIINILRFQSIYECLNLSVVHGSVIVLFQGLLRSLLVFIKVLAGSDRAKVEITRAGGIELILDAVRSHHKTAGICEAGFAAIGAIVLRFPAHSELVVEAAGAEVICTAMDLHADSIAVQVKIIFACRFNCCTGKDYDNVHFVLFVLFNYLRR
jgi:hypothetical protein